jgi:signal peptidase I
VFRSPADGKRLVKRVAAVPGDVIEMRNDRLFLNGQPASYKPSDLIASESALVFDETVAGRTHPVMICPAQRALRSFGPVGIPAGRYFVMGDNRDNSFDSRYFGLVSRDVIVAQATAVAMSFDRDHYWRPRFARFGRRLP